jgi:mannose/fructose/N-acetylgalactosamine-specific phosphotransferase system component IID
VFEQIPQGPRVGDQLQHQVGVPGDLPQAVGAHDVGVLQTAGDRPLPLEAGQLLRGPLGALGDCLFWQNFRPALLILGLILAERFGIWGVLGAWLIFNLYQIYLRARGMVKGYNLGMNISSDLNRGHLQSMIRWSSRMGAGFSGILLVFKYHQLSMQAWEPEKIIPFLAFILLSFLSFKRNINPAYILFSFLVIFLGLKVLLSWI